MAGLILCGAWTAGMAAELPVEGTRSYTHPTLGLTALRGEIELPVEGIWEAVEPTPGGPVRSVFLLVPPSRFTERRGEMATRIEQTRRIEQRRWRIQMFFAALQDYAARHEGIGPDTLADVAADEKAPAHHRETARRYDRELAQEGIHLFLVPKCPIAARAALAAGAATPSDAAAMHERLMGYRPVHPLRGEWVLRDGHIASSLYGAPLRQRQPPYDPDRDFGVLQGVGRLSVQMQLEGSGLRSVVSWTTTP